MDGPSILIVDDTEAHLELLKSLLEVEGIGAIPTSNALEALEMVENHLPDMAILDVMMPGMNGYELCRRLKEKAGVRFFPVILVTSLTGLEDKVTGLEAGADDFISKPFKTIEVMARVRSLLRLKRLQEELDHSESIILTLAVALEARDPYTRGHSERVADLSGGFAAFIGFSEEEQALIRKAGILHDIGKIGVWDSLLRKEDPLTEEELLLIREHPVIGERICRPLYSLASILPAIRYHHERWDGYGVPDGLKGEEIPVVARLLSIVDAFDALTSKRPYRGSASVEEAIRRMEVERYSGQWDPSLVERFIEMMRVRSPNEPHKIPSPQRGEGQSEGKGGV